MNYSQRIDDIIKKNKDIANINYSINNKFIINLADKIEDIDKTDINYRINEITKLVYCQDWHKLHIINKKIKIDEFLNELFLKNNNYNFTNIKTELINRLENKQLNKKDVQYDKINGKILDILCLNKENNKFYLT